MAFFRQSGTGVVFGERYWRVYFNFYLSKPISDWTDKFNPKLPKMTLSKIKMFKQCLNDV